MMIMQNGHYIDIPDYVAAEIITRVRINGEYQHKVAMDYPFSTAVIGCLLKQFDDNYDEIDCYIAGGFFSEAQIKAVQSIEDACEELGVKYFSPRLRGGIIKDMSEEERAEMVDKIYGMNVRAIERCKTVIAIIDGFDPGTMFEIGMAAASNKRIITVRNEGHGLNVMLDEPVEAHTGSATDAVKAHLHIPFTDLKIDVIT